MDCQDYITIEAERKCGQHLQAEQRGAIQALRRSGCSMRAIGRAIGCSPTTVSNELKRGTPPRKSGRGRAPGYSAKRGAAVYTANRKNSHKPHKIVLCAKFLDWVVKQFREHDWSLDACAGYALLHQLFTKEAMVCSKTLYNELWAGNSPLSVTELPEALKRKIHKSKVPAQNKRIYGNSIEQRPAIAALREEEGHWEGDTVVGQRSGKGPVVFSLIEKKTQNYLAFLIPGRNSQAVQTAMEMLKADYGDNFSKVFKTITVDNGPEFADFAKVAQWGSGVYYAHPYTSWERAQNERHNGLFRLYVPKGASMEHLSCEYVISSADELNGRPRKKLGYRTPEELFDAFLDRVYND